MQVRELTFRIRLHVEQDDGGYHAFCPDLKGLHASGETEQEALTFAREAVGLYIESLMKHGQSIPVGVVAFDETHPSLGGYVWRKICQRLLGRRPKEFVEDIHIPDCIAAA